METLKVYCITGLYRAQDRLTKQPDEQRADGHRRRAQSATARPSPPSGPWGISAGPLYHSVSLLYEGGWAAAVCT